MAEGDLPPLFDITPEQRDKMIEDLAQKIFKLGMATPAILFLETHRPFSRIAGNALHVLSPALGTIVPLVDHYGVLLNDPKNLDILIDRLHEMEQERVKQERMLREERRARARARRLKLLGFDPDKPEEPGADRPRQDPHGGPPGRRGQAAGDETEQKT
ncbi:MAG TPA: hypothetical protein DGR79_01655 [Clostridiales bacterium]|nr:hypothetical protein [Clostridiales bacterium]